jgi:endogenous inhibitor of DNA gyrase (YacG/DUF329 family)
MAGPRPGEWPEFPFCSPRCRLIDLGRWLGERYALPGEADEDAEEFGLEEDRIH